MKQMQRIACFVVGVCLTVACASEAFAEGFSLSDWGARGTGLVGGMVGRADDPSAVAHNPAGITQLPGTQVLGGFTVITPMGKVYTTNQATGATRGTSVERHWWVNPHAFLTHQINDNMWFGFGLFSRFGLGNSYPNDWPGRANLVDVKLQTVSLNPNIAYKVTDSLSLAVGLELMGAEMVMHKDTFMGALGYNNQRLSGRSVAPGFNVAMHYTFNDQWAAGLTYRSRVVQHVKGKSRWDKDYSAIPSLHMMQDSDLHGRLHLPDVISAGITYKPLHNLSFELGAVYTVWSAYRSFNIHLEGPASYTSNNPKNWHDTWGLNVSVEYKPQDWLALRAGYAYETSPMNKKTMDYMTPSDGRNRFSLGAGFNWDNWTVDVAYAYILINSINYDNSKAVGMLPGHARGGDSHVVSTSVGYKF